jgi:RHH-type transcriptional regulator, proline utilization regulon repressor / proline dehydrogenase / delta 1-pyrroline-5-carboxylate dehydrogenase
VLGLMPRRTSTRRWPGSTSPASGSPAGIHSLDDDEVSHWLEHVEVGNAYVNRHITGAIVRRQPFGGWKRSNVGPGAKAGGPNYLTQLGPGTTTARSRASTSRGVGHGSCSHGSSTAWAREDRLTAAAASDQQWWEEHFAREHDPTGLTVESNVLRYRPFGTVVIRLAPTGSDADAARAALAARRTGARVELSAAGPGPLDGILDATVHEGAAALAARLGHLEGACLRVVGEREPGIALAALSSGVRQVDEPPVTTGRIELLRVLREQAVSRTLHRHGHVPRRRVRPR